jgi:hypothetical protein
MLGLLATAILGLGALPDALAQSPSILLIRGATIIDGVSDAPLRDRSLLIEGSTIRDVLPATAAAPAGAQVLDLGGKFIIPGLFDSHVHWEDYMGELFINHGVTSIVALENAPRAMRAHPGRPGSSAVLSPGGTAATLQRRRGSRCPPDGADLAPEQTRFAWFAQCNARNARAYAIAADEAHKAGFMIFGHTDNAPGSVRDGMDIIEHSPKPSCRRSSCVRSRKANSRPGRPS